DRLPCSPAPCHSARAALPRPLVRSFVRSLRRCGHYRARHPFPTRRSSDLTLTEIQATIYCERASHKGIIIGKQGAMLRTIGTQRSEEHTSELQSRFDLVCRLLLEKKNRMTTSSGEECRSAWTAGPATVRTM